jgi:1-phosphatidylinositol-3-phosphate 5-kinase
MMQTKEALKEDSDENDEHSEGADDEFDEEEGEVEEDKDRGKKESNESFGNDPTSPPRRATAPPHIGRSRDSSDSVQEGTSSDIGPPKLSKEPVSIPSSPMFPNFAFPLSGNMSATMPRITSAQFSESEMSSSGTDNKSSLIKTISSLWAYRGCEFSPLEYPL